MQQQTGGNLAEMLDKLAAVIRDRQQAQLRLLALTGESRLQANVLLAMPPVMFAVLWVLKRAYVVLLLKQPLLLVADVRRPGARRAVDSRHRQTERLTQRSGGRQTQMTAATLISLFVFLLLGGGWSWRSGWATGRAGCSRGWPTCPASRRPPAIARCCAAGRRHLAARWSPPLLLTSVHQRTRLQARMLQAGLYHAPELQVYMGVKMALLFTPWLVGLALAMSGRAAAALRDGGSDLQRRRTDRPRIVARQGDRPPRRSCVAGCTTCWTSWCCAWRPARACTAAFQLVTTELRQSSGSSASSCASPSARCSSAVRSARSLRNLAERCGLEEIGVLASTVEQTERLGASLVRSLRIQAEQLRFRRTQLAEERAQKAGGKILFPTLLFIFPCIFITLLGPAAIQVQEVLSNEKPPNGRPACGKSRRRPR